MKDSQKIMKSKASGFYEQDNLYRPSESNQDITDDDGVFDDV